MTASTDRRRSNRIELSSAQYDAVVLDLDGVITSTAGVHAAAWKFTFDEFLARLGNAETFDIDTDYRRYVDGKPRYEGVRSFLESQGIDLPYGCPDDPPDRQTVCGLGNRKNELFREKLDSEGPTVHPESVTFIRALRDAGFAVGVASSSRNCREVLEAAGIQDLFDVRVDGLDLDQLGLAGKPAPDMFIEAARRLRSDPSRTVGIEDANAGIEAINAAGFGLAIGVGKEDRADPLRDHGANIVVDDLSDIKVSVSSRPRGPHALDLPSALDHLDQILAGDEPAVFLDYDGTLTPIVNDPDAAELTDSMRAVLDQLCKVCTVAIISGRDLKDVQEKVGLLQLWYAGSHGFDIAGPRGVRSESEESACYLPRLDSAEKALQSALTEIEGCRVERKRFSVAVHYRQVAEYDLPRVEAAVQEVHRAHSGLRLATGKRIFELQPDVDWDKGRALAWLMTTLELDRLPVKPLYIGDDLTDEDGFRQVASSGAGIIVAPGDQATRASYRLADTDAVETFLKRLFDRLNEAER